MLPTSANTGVLPTSADTGVLADFQISEAIFMGWIKISSRLEPEQLQPASLDLRVGKVAYRLRAGFLPGEGYSVADKLTQVSLHKLDLNEGAVLETGCVYLIELDEALALPGHIAGKCNPKSTTGRLDLFCRVVTDNGRLFDEIPAGYHGALYLEVTPRTFPLRLHRGDCLTQMRLRGASITNLPSLDNQLMSINLDKVAPVRCVRNGKGCVGFRARKHTSIVDVRSDSQYPALDFWEPVYTDSHRRVVLDPEEFYIFSCCEVVELGPNYSAEMSPFDAEIGEFRVHYAGFFDPGFGLDGGARAVLEMRVRDIPFILEHGQDVGKLVYEPMAAPPRRLYGDRRELGDKRQMPLVSDPEALTKGNYQHQGLKLARQFTTPE